MSSIISKARKAAYMRSYYATPEYKEKRKLYDDRKNQKNPLRRLLRSTRHSARMRGLEFNITEEDLVIPEFCPYLGIPIIAYPIYPKGTPEFDCSASVDRIDPTKGYVKGNVQVISNLANRMKSNSTQEQLIVFAENVLRLHYGLPSE